MERNAKDELTKIEEDTSPNILRLKGSCSCEDCGAEYEYTVARWLLGDCPKCGSRNTSITIKSGLIKGLLAKKE